MAKISERAARLEPHPARPQRPEPARRRMGTIIEAVIAVLGSGLVLRTHEIHAGVEEVLDEPVARSSIRNCLANNSQGREDLFVRVRRGLYFLN